MLTYTLGWEPLNIFHENKSRSPQISVILGCFLSCWCGQRVSFSTFLNSFQCHQLAFFFPIYTCLVSQTTFLEEIWEEFFIPITSILLHYLVFEETADTTRGTHQCEDRESRTEQLQMALGRSQVVWIGFRGWVNKFSSSIYLTHPYPPSPIDLNLKLSPNSSQLWLNIGILASF